jgi:hypothetical protein
VRLKVTWADTREKWPKLWKIVFFFFCSFLFLFVFYFQLQIQNLNPNLYLSADLESSYMHNQRNTRHEYKVYVFKINTHYLTYLGANNVFSFTKNHLILNIFKGIL